MTMVTGARQRTSPARGVPGRGSRPDGVDQRRTVLIDRPRHELYRVLRALEILPRFLDHLAAVSVDDDETWSFLVRDGDREIRWRCRITEDVPGSCVAWESLPGGDVIAGGSLTLSDGRRGGTVVDLDIWYRPSDKQAPDEGVQQLFRVFGGRRLAQNLLFLRTLIETDILRNVEPAQLAASAAPVSDGNGGLHAHVLMAPRG